MFIICKIWKFTSIPIKNSQVFFFLIVQADFRIYTEDTLEENTVYILWVLSSQILNLVKL